MKIQVKRKAVDTELLPLNQSTFNNKLMNEHNLAFSFISPITLDLKIGDYIEYKGDRFTINKTGNIKRDHLRGYDVVFEGSRHTLSRLFLKHEGSRDFSFTGTPDEFMFFFLASVNTSDSGWTLGEVEDLEPVTVYFDNTYCLDALTMIAQAFEAEWDIKGKVITLKKKVGTAKDFPLSYGMGNGLYSLTRQEIQGKSIITRAYAEGGDKNLPEGMHGKFRLDDYIENNVELYGLHEGVYVNEDIYPQRTSTATAVGQSSAEIFTLTDDTLDFDIWDHLVSGETAKIVFKTGMLSSVENFEITGYNHATKTIRYKANKDSNGNLIPVGATIAEVGDSYTIIGIRLPQSYVDAATAELIAGRLEYLSEHSAAPPVAYDLDVDLLELKRRETLPEPGDIVPLTDTELNIDELIRVTSISYPGHYPDVLEQGMKFTAEVGNEVTYTLIQKVQNDIKEHKEVVTQYSKTSWENDRRNVQALNEFIGKVLDPDGNLAEPILQAIVGMFGTPSMYYDLDGVSMSVNNGGDENAFAMTAGRLIHKVYKLDGLGYIWNLAPFSIAGLDPLKTYYLAAKCSKTSLTGEWVLTEEMYKTEGDVAYWYFNFGQLSSVLEGVRSFKSTKGFTVISGGEIETDVITAFMINVQRLFAQVITVGSNGFVNAGISGENDFEELSQRFWAGATEENRYYAPFQVLDDGSMQALKGTIGNFDINTDSLSIGSKDTWMAFMQSVFLYKDYFLLRDNGAIAGERRELSWNLYKNQQGFPLASAASIFNTMNTYSESSSYTNIALELEASGGNHNYALYINKGLSRFKGIVRDFQEITGSNQTIDDQCSLSIILPDIVVISLYLPTFPKKGYSVIVKNMSANDFDLRSNNGSILQIDGSYVMANSFRRYSTKEFIHNGQYWLEMFNNSN